ncbi:MAG: sulfite exporter TauE/SafE family protein [Phycisphaerales bacterium]|nr:MAG: sulfite exporter TauE/SafE family protein [Phycisphaerales bacterium]
MIAQSSFPPWAFVVLGVCAGLLSGGLGVGSGIVLVPALVLLAGFGQKSAQGMALAVMVPMALVGAGRYWRNPDIELSGAVIGLIVIGALAGTLLGTELAIRLPGPVLRKAFAVFLVAAAVRMFVASPGSKDAGAGGRAAEQKVLNVNDGGIDGGSERQ